MCDIMIAPPVLMSFKRAGQRSHYCQYKTVIFQGEIQPKSLLHQWKQLLIPYSSFYGALCCSLVNSSYFSMDNQPNVNEASWYLKLSPSAVWQQNTIQLSETSTAHVMFWSRSVRMKAVGCHLPPMRIIPQRDVYLRGCRVFLFLTIHVAFATLDS